MYIYTKYIPMKTQQHTLDTFNRKHNNKLQLDTFERNHNNILVRLHHRFSNSLHLILLYKDLQYSLAWNCKDLLGRLVLHYTMCHILDPISLLFYMEFECQWLSLLYSKRSLWDSCLVNSQAIPEQIFLYILWMFYYLKSYGMARDHAYRYSPSFGLQRNVISISWIRSLWYFALSMYPFTFLRAFLFCL